MPLPIPTRFARAFDVWRQPSTPTNAEAVNPGSIVGLSLTDPREIEMADHRRRLELCPNGLRKFWSGGALIVM